MSLMNKASELRTDLRWVSLSDTAAGSPDTEIGYTQFISLTYLKRLVW